MGPVEFVTDDSKKIKFQWKIGWTDVRKEVNGEARRFFENESNEISSLDDENCPRNVLVNSLVGTYLAE